MPSGLRVLDCYEAVRPVRALTYLRAEVTLEYDHGVPDGAAEGRIRGPLVGQSGGVVRPAARPDRPASR